MYIHLPLRQAKNTHSVFEVFHQITALVIKKLNYLFAHFKNTNKHSSTRKPPHFSGQWTRAQFLREEQGRVDDLAAVPSGEIYNAHGNRGSILHFVDKACMASSCQCNTQTGTVT